MGKEIQWLATLIFVFVLQISFAQAADQAAKQDVASAPGEESWMETQASDESWTAQEISETNVGTPAETSTPESVSDATSRVSGTAIPSEIQLLIQNGELAKAREELLKLWKETTDPLIKDQVEGGLSQVDTQLLSSKEKFPGAAEYRVKPGDSLYVIAKKYKTSVRLIQVLNGLQSDLIRPGQRLKVLRGNFSITIDKSDNLLKLFLGDQFFKRYIVATGATSDLTPVGTFTVANKLENPTWFKAGVKAIPPGSPENLLGTRWLGFSKSGYGIHGTIQPESIGQHVTSGCVRMMNNEVEELYDLVPVGTKVTVVE